jgi:hypothetical protein
VKEHALPNIHKNNKQSILSLLKNASYMMKIIPDAVDGKMGK